MLAKQTKAMVVSNFEITTWVEKQGYQKVHPMNIGGNKRFNSVEVKMVNAIHSSSFPDGSYAGNPGGFVIKGEKESVYFAGDTSLHFDMKLIAEEFALAAAILPLGDNFTMGVDDAVKAAKWVNCNRIIGMHYNTFGYIQIDEAQAIQKFKSEGMQLDLMTIGSRIEVETNILTSK
ncbi:MAG: L-ascorbate metabolism protein UlaG (beta-lactamase superfamily) [Bacteroidia bacterium]